MAGRKLQTAVLQLFLLVGIQFLAVHGYVSITEELRNVVLGEGERAKFVCKVDVHHLDEKRLQVIWKANGQFLKPEESGRMVFKNEGTRFALIVRNVKTKDTGIYTCIAKVGLETAMSSAHLQIKSKSRLISFTVSKIDSFVFYSIVGFLSALHIKCTKTSRLYIAFSSPYFQIACKSFFRGFIFFYSLCVLFFLVGSLYTRMCIFLMIRKV
ncbi:uncharacterized protein LOC106011661 [Aplysia californica]|uniref:Uncharacterized protein LOC106011661 n=1 Tax=Aplysia californica TaxID=6500 RepID=A0ABM0ZZ56_APLCA|nr:uncharacterized protein LOC106011661 [Aplysia californica]